MVLVITTGNEDNPIYLDKLFWNFPKMPSIFDPNCQKGKKYDKDFLRIKESKRECVIHSIMIHLWLILINHKPKKEILFFGTIIWLGNHPIISLTRRSWLVSFGWACFFHKLSVPRAQVPGVSGPSNVQSKAFLGAQRMVGTQVRRKMGETTEVWLISQGGH